METSLGSNASFNVDDVIEDVDSDDLELMPANSRLTSVVWHSFERKRSKSTGVVYAICNSCGKKLKGASTSGTTHLKNHLKRCAANKDSEEHSNKRAKTDTWVFDQEVVRKALGLMIILHDYPLSMVEHVGFREFMQKVQPLFKSVSRNTIKSDILKLYDIDRLKTISLLRNSKGRIAITTDMWTASNQTKGYMAITAHFVDDEWKLQGRLIRFMHVASPHTAEVLCNCLVDCLVKDWGIDMKLSSLTLDNCSTNDSMVNQLKSKFTARTLLLRGNLLHMRCAAHILHLIVKDGLNEISDAIEKIRNSVVFWTGSPKRLEIFQKSVKDVDKEYSRKLVLDCRTRWNSTYKMIESALFYKPAFTRAKIFDSNYKCLPSDDEWEVAELVCIRLKVFYKATEIFSGTKYPTTNLFFPRVCTVRFDLYNWQVSDNEVVRRMAAKMMIKFDKYWKDTHGIMAIGTILDPRYKIDFIEFMFQKIYGDEATYEIEKVRTLCDELVNEYLSRKTSSNVGSRGPSSSGESSAQTDLTAEFDDYIATSGRVLASRSDLDAYLAEPLLPKGDYPDSDFDILSWWKINGFRFPVLGEMARDLLAIPISTVASESAFSTGGRVLSSHRSRLHQDTVEALMCCQNWLWGERKGSSSASLVGSSYYDEDEDKDEEDEEE